MATDPVLDELQKDYDRLRAQKCRPWAGIEGRTLLNLGFVYDEQHIEYHDKGLRPEARDDNKLYLQFNLIKPRLQKLLGRLTSIDGTYRAQPDKDDPKARANGEVCDILLKALDDKLKQPTSTWTIWWWMAVAGTAFVYVPWIPNATFELNPVYSEGGELMYDFTDPMTKQTTQIPESQYEMMVASGGIPPEAFQIAEQVEMVGEVGDCVLSPLNVFIDQSAKSVESLAPDQWVHIAEIKTVGWVEENFGRVVEPDADFKIVSTTLHPGISSGGAFLKDLIPMVQGSADANDPPMVVVVQSYQNASKKNPHGRYVCWIPGKEVLHDEENPYGEIPLVDFHWTPPTTSFWTADYVTGLIPPQRFINKRFSQMGEQANASLYANTLLGGGLEAEDLPTDTAAPIEGGLNENGQALVQRVPPPEFPTWFIESTKMTLQMFNDSAGGADLLQESQFPGQLRGPQAVPMLQEILDTTWGPLYQHFGERMARVKQMRLNRVKQYYPPIRTLNYVSRDLKDEVLDFHKEEVLNAGTNYSITVERASLLPEMRALREARVQERLAGPLSILYLDERTGRFDKSKIAADIKFGDGGREGREAQYRKLGAQIVDMLWQGQPLPPVLPFYDHGVMMDELEAAMSTMEYLRASPQIQQGFAMRYEGHRQFMIQEAQAQAQAMQSGMIQNAVAQATQQAAAMASARAVDSSMAQMEAQKGLDTDSITRSAIERTAQPQNKPPQAGKTVGGGGRSRKVTIEEKQK